MLWVKGSWILGLQAFRLLSVLPVVPPWASHAVPPGHLFHIDFGFVLGDDPKPLSPPVRLPAQIAQALIASKRLNKCH